MTKYEEAIQTFQHLPAERKDLYVELLAGERLPVIDFSADDMEQIQSGRADFEAGRTVSNEEMTEVFASFR